MVRPLPFTIAFFVLLTLCVASESPQPGRDWFVPLPPGQALALDRLAVDELAALKLGHLYDSPPVNLLLLGNSRQLPVGAAEMQIPPERFFNVALTGESLRSSVAILEHLRARGKLPKIAIISFDNTEIQYYNNPQWPHLSERWSLALRDLAAGLTRPDISKADLARMVRRHILTEADIFIHMLAFERVSRGLWIRWARLSGQDERTSFLAPVGYLADGSRPHPVDFTPFVDATPLPAPNRNVLPGFLNYDLERLAAIAAEGTRIVIFETVLAPSLHSAAMASPSRSATEARNALLALCARHRLECRTAPAIYDTHGLAWQDSAHPPAAVMVDLMRPFIQAKGSAHDFQ